MVLINAKLFLAYMEGRSYSYIIKIEITKRNTI